MEEIMLPLSSKFRLIPAALAMSAVLFAADAAYAHHGSGYGGGGGGYVPVHGSPPLNGGGGVLVTHGNLKLPPPPVTIVRDHRHGGYRGCGYGYYRGSCGAPGGIIAGKPADPPYGGLPQGGTVRDHRH
jgi:hypothetical protein